MCLLLFRYLAVVQYYLKDYKLNSMSVIDLRVKGYWNICTTGNKMYSRRVEGTVSWLHHLFLDYTLSLLVL